MSIIKEIQSWSQSIAPWQQDAVARLYTDRILSASDFEDLYALAKSEHGIADPKGRTPSVLAAQQIAAPNAPNRLVQLTAIKNLQNVNALAHDQRLPIANTGLTVIYGENGAGKSGYSRILKQACRARDRNEPILPDARKAPDKASVASAVFEAMIDGQPVELVWTYGAAAPEPLSEIAIFDSHCARAYIDNDGDFAYVPYGLDILEGLAKTSQAIKARAQQDATEAKPNIQPFASLAKTVTEVGRLLFSLSAETDPKEVQRLGTLADSELARLDVLNKALASADPKQRAQELRRRATRFTSLATRAITALVLVSDSKIEGFKSLIAKSKASEILATSAAQEFKSTPGLLPGSGDDLWKTLFEAARGYTAVSHAGHGLAHLPPESPCPLCQNTLGTEGSARLAAFDAYIHQETERLAKEAKSAATDAYQAISESNLDIAIDESLLNELTETLPDLADVCVALQEEMNARKASVMEAVAGKVSWATIKALPIDPSEALVGIAKKLNDEAQALLESADENTKTAMVAEQGELVARVGLSEILETVLDAIAKFVLASQLQSCCDSITTTGISRKSTDLSRTMARQEVVDALNAELSALNVHELHATMKPESPGGKTQFKLTLELPGGGQPAAILSEGEQRAIAIASFLAEVNLAKRLGGVIFDDPVSSLDHKRRWSVASRLAKESLRRQVIVFTHDIYFLCILQQEAEALGIEPLTQCIQKGEAGFGVQSNMLPFDALVTSKRVKALRNLHNEVERVHIAGDQTLATKLTREAYSHVRMAWERAVEEVLFAGVVTRFSEGVSTHMLRFVTVEDSDYKEIDVGMTRCSKFSGHDPAAAAQLPTPHPDILKADIEKLETWRLSVVHRKDAVKDRRT